MKKKIIILFIASSLVMGANTIDNLTIVQKNKITTNSSINNATVHQGKTEILDASYIDNVYINPGDSTTIGNLIENTDIVGIDEANRPIVYQGFVKIQNSEARDLKFKSINNIQNVGTIYGNSSITQGSFIITDSNVTDSSSLNAIELNALNVIDNTSIDANNIDINATEIKQDVVLFEAGAIVDDLSIKYKNRILNSKVEDTHIYQGILNVNSSTVNNLTIRRDTDDKSVQLIARSTIIGGSIVQNSIDISNYSNVENLYSASNNKIQASTLTNSTISQSETTIN
ncbi:MAG: hypothetical protein KAU90_01200 [Sulfurovaceae bacterium]|nr:hypothetical protein [Sulfurovaceae bacterium]